MVLIKTTSIYEPYQEIEMDEDKAKKLVASGEWTYQTKPKPSKKVIEKVEEVEEDGDSR